MNPIRCFVAADFPEEVREGLAHLQRTLRDRGVDLRWVAPGSLHVTLKFMGALPSETFEAAQKALEEPLGLGLGAPLRLSARGLGAFPSARRARVVWVGLTGDVAALARAALILEARLEPLGIAREARPFTPHLTLGRARDPAGVPGLAAILEAQRDYEGPEFAISELVLYESRLRPQGSLYLPRKTIALT